MNKRLVLLLLILPALSLAITISSTPVCQFNGSPATSCGATGPGGAVASASGNAVLVDAAGSLTVTGTVATYASGNIFAIANANVALTVGGNFLTAGSGAGYLLITPAITATASGSAFSSLSYSLAGTTYSCSSNPLSGCNFPQPVKVPITLGLSLPFLLQESAGSVGNSNGSSISSASASLILAAFLADGVTPIAIFDEIPEPQTWLLMLLGLALILQKIPTRIRTGR